MAFYFGEIISLAVCWLFYCEFRWVLERRMHKVCSNEFISKRCVTFSDKLFFTPVSGKVNFGLLYYMNIIIFFILLILSGFHILLGWIGVLRSMIKFITTLFMLLIGIIGAVSSMGSMEEICIELNIGDKPRVKLLKAVSFTAELLVMLTYLYMAWVFIF